MAMLSSNLGRGRSHGTAIMVITLICFPDARLQHVVVHRPSFTAPLLAQVRGETRTRKSGGA